MALEERCLRSDSATPTVSGIQVGDLYVSIVYLAIIELYCSLVSKQRSLE